uniref:uncharacterized protein LOC122610747 n=1 Tax=Erigeron canadensis TaxID=72917 RepID=UPI001CB94060|nr:uncharacterized protein LOC122610747 [Erigeron canadensis]
MQIQDVEGRLLSPSFSCYSNSDSLTSKAISKVIHEEHKLSRFDEFRDVQGEDDFEFSSGLREEEEASSEKAIDIKEAWKTFPVFDHDLTVDREIDDGSAASITNSLQKLFIDVDHEEEESSSRSSSEADELENIQPGTFCLWSPKAESGSSSPGMTKCKKSSSTGSSGSKKWKIMYSFKRSNSEGNKDPMVSIDHTTSPKRKRIISGKLKTQTPVHELFYVQRRAENEMSKKKSYLPYRKDMFGLFANVNIGTAKMHASLLR